MYIAFKKTKSTVYEKLISFFTKSEYVHCEFVTEKLMNRFLGYSCDPKDGVRGKWISFTDKDWDFIQIPRKYELYMEFMFDHTIGTKYDYLGVLGFVFKNRDDPKRYFCSEWIATILEIDEPSKISPGKLYNILKDKKYEYY